MSQIYDMKTGRMIDLDDTALEQKKEKTIDAFPEEKDSADELEKKSTVEDSQTRKKQVLWQDIPENEPEDVQEEIFEEPIEEEKIEETTENTNLPENENSEIILDGIKALHEKFDQKIAHSEEQDTLSKTLYAELQEYKKGLYSSVMKPLLMDMIQVRNDILKQGNSLIKKNGEDTMIKVSTFLSYAEDIQDILEKYDVDVFSSQSGDDFDARRHKMLKKVDTDDVTLNKKICESLAEGYEYAQRVIIKENVTVYSYISENEKDK